MERKKAVSLFRCSNVKKYALVFLSALLLVNFSVDANIGNIDNQSHSSLNQQKDSKWDDFRKHMVNIFGGIVAGVAITVATSYLAKKLLNNNLLQRPNVFVTKNTPIAVSLADFVGDVPTEVLNLVKRFKQSHRYKIPISKGYLFHGPPGTGKTYLASTIAGELQCPFFYQNGPDFMQSIMGQSEQAVKNIFNAAKIAAQASPSKKAIIFIDEIDVIAKPRVAGQGNNYYDSIVNAFLAELDGFEDKTLNPQGNQIIVIGATNFHPAHLDPALMREGRMGVHVEFHNPSLKDLVKITEYQIKKFDMTFEPTALEYLKQNLNIQNPAQITGLLRSIEQAFIDSSDSVENSVITVKNVREGLDVYSGNKKSPLGDHATSTLEQLPYLTL